jgi:hypothetical protein
MIRNADNPEPKTARCSPSSGSSLSTGRANSAGLDPHLPFHDLELACFCSKAAQQQQQIL